MKVENEQIRERRQASAGSDGHPQEKEPHRQTQAERDEEIAAMQQRSRHQTQAVVPPPEVPPAPPRRALIVVGVALLVLIVAGAITLIIRFGHEQSLAKETEQQTVPTVAVVHPFAD